jgi:hypothetical protein
MPFFVDENKNIEIFSWGFRRKFPFGREKSSAVLQCLISSLPYLNLNM